MDKAFSNNRGQFAEVAAAASWPTAPQLSEGTLTVEPARKPLILDTLSRTLNDAAENLRAIDDPACDLAYYSNQSIARNAPYRFRVESSLIPGRSQKDHELIAVFKGRSEGLAEIRQHFSKKNEEHTWIFVPALSLWIDDTTDPTHQSVDSDFHVRATLLNQFGQVEVFHTHPESSYEQLHRAGDLPKEYRIIAATPSPNDQLKAYVLEDAAGPAAKLVSHIVSHYGITSYERTDLFREGKLNGGPFLWNFSIIDSSTSPEREIERICALLQNEISCMHLANGSTTPAWNIRFSPIDK